MALRGIPPVATPLQGMMDKSVSLEKMFETLDNEGNTKGMWDLITMPGSITMARSKWPNDLDRWFLAPNAAPLARLVQISPTGWFQNIDKLDESFAHLIKLVGEQVKIIDLLNKTYLNGKSGKKGDVFVKQGQLGVCVTLDDGRSLMVKPANIEPKYSQG